MKCIVKGCDKDVFQQMLCKNHYDPDKQTDAEERGVSAEPTLGISAAQRLSVAAHAALLVSGKLAGRMVNGYKRFFTLTKSERAQVLSHIGSSELRKGHKADSLAAFENAVKLNPADPEALFSLGGAYMVAEEFRKAAETYVALLELDPDRQEVFELLGEAHYHSGEYDDALEWLLKARTLNGQNVKVTYLLGWTYDKLDSFEKAVKFLQAAVDLSPRTAKYYYSLGFTYDTHGKKDKALENFKRAMELEKSSTNV